MAATIPIKGTFDIAVARNMLRKTAEGSQWPTVFRARAAAALTALAEMVLFSQNQQVSGLMLNINFIEKGARCGIEFSCSTHLPVGTQADYITHAWGQLERASDEVKIEEHGGSELIVVRVWMK